MNFDTEKCEAWIFEVHDQLESLKTFRNSDFWVQIEDWMQNSHSILTTIKNQHMFEEKIYVRLEEIIIEAEQEIEWAGKAIQSFSKIVSTLVYPLAWDLWDRSTFAIGFDDFNVTEIIGTYDDQTSNKTDKDNTDYSTISSYFIIEDNEEIRDIKIKLNKINISPGASVYSGSASASKLHMISRVPSIPEYLGIQHTVDRILDSQLERNQWQRPLIQNRTKHIQNFLAKQGNFFMNPVIIHLDESSSDVAKIDKADDGFYLTIDFKAMLNIGSENKHFLFGNKRPLDIIDGQHRVRGAARSTMGSDIEIPFILAPPVYYSTDNAAKLFTEINTTSKELDKDHQLFLAFRYNLPHYKSELTMGDFSENKKNWHDRSNRMAYELAAKLSKPDMSLHNHIKFLSANKGNYCVDITQWQKYVKQWFMPGNPYDLENELEPEEIVIEVENYFRAWISIIGDCWVSGDNIGWNTRSIFQRKTHFRILLSRFIQVHGKTNSPNRIISVDEFVEILSPISNLDSNDPSLVERYNKTGEFPWKCLDTWVMDALSHGHTYSKDDVHSSIIKGKAGKGVMAGVLPSEKWKIEDDQMGNWPEDGKTRYLTVHRPKNCYRTLKISVHDGNEVLSGLSRQKITANNNDICKVPIRFNESLLNGLEKIEIRLIWSNQNGTQEKIIDIER